MPQEPRKLTVKLVLDTREAFKDVRMLKRLVDGIEKKANRIARKMAKIKV
jgi:hypothetical protein